MVRVNPEDWREVQVLHVTAGDDIDDIDDEPRLRWALLTMNTRLHHGDARDPLRFVDLTAMLRDAEPEDGMVDVPSLCAQLRMPLHDVRSGAVRHTGVSMNDAEFRTDGFQMTPSSCVLPAFVVFSNEELDRVPGRINAVVIANTSATLRRVSRVASLRDYCEAPHPAPLALLAALCASVKGPAPVETPVEWTLPGVVRPPTYDWQTWAPRQGTPVHEALFRELETAAEPLLHTSRVDEAYRRAKEAYRRASSVLVDAVADIVYDAVRRHPRRMGQIALLLGFDVAYRIGEAAVRSNTGIDIDVLDAIVRACRRRRFAVVSTLDRALNGAVVLRHAVGVDFDAGHPLRAWNASRIPTMLEIILMTTPYRVATLAIQALCPPTTVPAAPSSHRRDCIDYEACLQRAVSTVVLQ